MNDGNRRSTLWPPMSLGEKIWFAFCAIVSIAFLVPIAYATIFFLLNA